MATIYLTSPKILKDFYPIDDNIEDRYILPNILKGQRFIINKILGNVKYNEILTQFDTNTLTVQNKYIIDEYIEPILCYYTISEAYYSTAYKLKNLPVTETNPDSNRFEELVKLSRKYLRDSEQYQADLKEYICEEGVITDNEGKENTIKTGIFLGRSRRFPRGVHNIFIDNDNNCPECND